MAYNTPSIENPQKNVTYRAYDISKPVNQAVLADVDYLVHTAYVKYDAQHPDAMEVNLRGAEQLLQASRMSKLKRNIFISTMSAHDDAISVYGKQKMALETLFNSAEDTVLKCGLILGNGGIVKQMSDFMKSKHAVPLIGGGKQPLQIVAVDDLVRVIETVIEQAAAGTYVIATPQIYTYKDFYAALSGHLGVKILYVPVPYAALQLAFRLAAALHLPLGVGEDNLKGLKMLRAMDNAGDLEKLGVKLKELDQALATSGV
jgi:nucleoside-diphosphate-sugar epimerase